MSWFGNESGTCGGFPYFTVSFEIKYYWMRIRLFPLTKNLLEARRTKVDCWPWSNSTCYNLGKYNQFSACSALSNRMWSLLRGMWGFSHNCFQFRGILELFSTRTEEAILLVPLSECKGLLAQRSVLRGSEWGGPLVGCRLKFSYFVGSRLNFLIFENLS